MVVRCSSVIVNILAQFEFVSHVNSNSDDFLQENKSRRSGKYFISAETAGLAFFLRACALSVNIT